MISVREEKVRVLDPPVLTVDSGLESARPVMLGYRRAHTAPGTSSVTKVVTLRIAVREIEITTPSIDNGIAEGSRPRK